jgi:hypothetical protein
MAAEALVQSKGIIGITLGVLPALIKNNLQFDSFAVGIVIGVQSLATLLTRAYAGKTPDTRGAKTGVPDLTPEAK